VVRTKSFFSFLVVGIWHEHFVRIFVLSIGGQSFRSLPAYYCEEKASASVQKSRERGGKRVVVVVVVVVVLLFAATARRDAPVKEK
jgi:hypothetical protein